MYQQTLRPITNFWQLLHERLHLGKLEQMLDKGQKGQKPNVIKTPHFLRNFQMGLIT